MDIGVLVSGNLGLKVLKAIYQKYSVTFLLTDKNSTSIIEFCKDNKILFYAGNPRGKDAISKLNHPACDLLLSINYLFIINEDIFDYPKKMAVNFHGSLLPKFRGRTPHVWAIINNETTTGITAHLINDQCDAGDIIAQLEIPIQRDYTGGDLLNIYGELYPDFVMDTLKKIINNEIILKKQDDILATYFDKRTKEDGQINFAWQKERIYNWVRAQAHPYPGAFCFLGENKIIIDKIAFSNVGYNNSDKNGLVLYNEPYIVVKTPNGAIELKSIRGESGCILKGKILQ